MVHEVKWDLVVHTMFVLLWVALGGTKYSSLIVTPRNHRAAKRHQQVREN